MGKGSSRRREDRARVAANWDAIFAPKAVESGFAPFVKYGRPPEPGEVAEVYPSIRVASAPQTEREIPAPVFDITPTERAITWDDLWDEPLVNLE